MPKSFTKETFCSVFPYLRRRSGVILAVSFFARESGLVLMMATEISPVTRRPVILLVTPYKYLDQAVG
jgi:hypothetical protein